MFVPSVGSVPKTGPVRSGLQSRIGLVLILLRIALTNLFLTTQKFQTKNLGATDRCRPKLIEIRAILAIFEPFEVWKIRAPLFGECS